MVAAPEEEERPADATLPAERTEFEGQLYDYVFSIDVKDDEPALKLPYNLSRESP